MSANETPGQVTDVELVQWQRSYMDSLYTSGVSAISPELLAESPVMRLIAAVRERDAEIARLRAAFKRYGKHRVGCTNPPSPCSCGFEAASNALGEALRQTGTEPPQPAEGA